jgi:hypothetical protein
MYGYNNTSYPVLQVPVPVSALKLKNFLQEKEVEATKLGVEWRRPPSALKFIDFIFVPAL